MSLTEKDIEQLKSLIENKGNCSTLNVPCRLCVMTGWCQTWACSRGNDVKMHWNTYTQKYNKAKDILIYRRVNNHP